MLVVFARAEEALAWQCSAVLDNSGAPTGAALVWPTRTVPFSFNQNTTTRLPSEDALDAVRAAFANWAQSNVRDGNSCGPGIIDSTPAATDLSFVEGPPTAQAFAGYNYFDPNANVNAILFRDSRWPYPLTAQDDTERMALTTVTFNKLSGNIVDADIEFNTFDYAFSTGDQNIAWDLLNIATHEVGHFLGFAHSKLDEAVMFGSANYGETQKRTLSCDDAIALWFRYPQGQPTLSCGRGVGNLNDTCGKCAPPGILQLSPNLSVYRTDGGRGGCSCQSVGPGDASALAGALSLWALARRGRRGFRTGTRGDTSARHGSQARQPRRFR